MTPSSSCFSMSRNLAELFCSREREVAIQPYIKTDLHNLQWVKYQGSGNYQPKIDSKANLWATQTELDSLLVIFFYNKGLQLFSKSTNAAHFQKKEMYRQEQLFFFLKMFSMPNQDCGLAEMCVSTEYFSAIKSDRPLARPNSST